MSIRIAATVLGLSLAAAALPGVAQAQNVMKACGVEYQAAKAAKTLDGKNWQTFLADCRTRHAAATPAATPATTPAAPAAAQAAPPAAAPPAASTAPAPKSAAAPATGGRAAMFERERACGAEWRAQKVELRKANPTLKWPQYWSQCNARMKAAGK
jgi:hypothetical protein